MNLFGSVLPKNTIFCIDCSGSMYLCLPTIKEHIIAYLKVHLSDSTANLMFNLIEFHSDIRQWADRLVFWNKNSILVAEEWIRSLVAKTSTNTLTALLTALSEQMCEQIILITDGIPDQEPYFILQTLQNLGNLKPCHIFYVSTPNSQNTSEEETVVKFLTDLAKISCGSLTIANFSQTGMLKNLVPIVTYYPALPNSLIDNSGIIFLNEINNNQIIESSVIQPSPPQMMIWNNTDTTPENKEIEIARSPEIGSLLIGQEVIARKATDGYYYRGKILNQLSTHQFMVEFGPKMSGAYKESDFQETTLHDIIHYRDALMHTIKRGDYVLGPIVDSQGKYVPGEVLDGFEKRSSCEDGEEKLLVIHFTNGKTVTMKRSNEAIWIPSLLYERIKFESSMPPSARQFLEIHSVSYPSKLLPGYPSKSSSIPLAYDTWPFFVPLIKSYSKSVVNEHSVNSHDLNSLVPDRLMTKDELNRKVDQQIEKHRMLLDRNQQENKPILSSARYQSNCCSHPPQHSHSYSASPTFSSTTTSTKSKKKSVCFDENSINGRKYSVDDMYIRSQSPSLKSCLKSSNSSSNIFNDTEHRPHQIPLSDLVQNSATQTSTIPKEHHNNNESKQPSNKFHETKPPVPIELWKPRTIKSAPNSSSYSHQTHIASRRPNMGRIYEQAQRDAKAELHKQQWEREQFKKRQANDQAQLIANRQQQEIDKAERILNAKKYHRQQAIHSEHQRTQTVQNDEQNRLRLKQSQYAQKSFDSYQRQVDKEQNDAELLRKRQTNQMAHNQAYHSSVLINDFDRLYNDNQNRKVYNNRMQKAAILRDREQKRNDFIKDVEKRRVAWTNSSIIT
ncbi:unnamed protein product [Didymodactylos carnosus]|uniref:DUF4537 domain-containing protein n=1 Tax=Didymodactylos carnosus TaxID=1234261 RepID=A0A813PH53_9BILA|nr:unnamed protein product [Didymodactylos carnosus]CAF0754917.1 unnamed protein product [Didymodactylos carnosus]CAF3502456.1 unnamed protein product [Didymodactylos carnosus]CAF3535142.1 unnamed protein product [Didymodactylos carnosus]